MFSATLLKGENRLGVLKIAGKPQIFGRCLALRHMWKVNNRQSAVYFLEKLLAQLIVAEYAALRTRRVMAPQ